MSDLREDRHTPECKHPVRLPGEPHGYLDWHAWAEKKTKTHHQERCPHCGLFAIWLPKVPEADS